jgi:glycerophosphoryl diester phosphodiesterase
MAYNANLHVYPWTFRADADIGAQFNNSFEDEELYFICCLRVDGLFTEFPDKTRETINNLHVIN